MSQGFQNYATAALYNEAETQNSSPPASGTLSFWFAVGTANGDTNSVKVYGYDTTNTYCWLNHLKDGSDDFCFAQVNGTIYAGWLTSNTAYFTKWVLSASPFTANAWNHVCLTWAAGGNVNLWINGVELTPTSRANSTAYASSVGYFFLGGGGGGNNYSNISGYNKSSDACGGDMAHVAIWSEVLSASDIAKLAAGMLPAYIGMVDSGALAAEVHYWPLTSNTTTDAWGTLNLTSSQATQQNDNTFNFTTSTFPGLNNNGSSASPTDDSTVLNALIAQSGAYGGTITWNTCNAILKTLTVPSNTTIVPTTAVPVHVVYFGPQSSTVVSTWPSGVADYALRNQNFRKGFPVFGTTLASDGSTAINLPLGLGSAINSTTATSMTLGTKQGQLIDTLARVSASGGKGLYLTLSDGTHTETVLVSLISTDTLTIARAQLGTSAYSWPNATTWNASGGGLASSNAGPTIVETILDTNITIGPNPSVANSCPLVINHNGNILGNDGMLVTTLTAGMTSSSTSVPIASATALGTLTNGSSVIMIDTEAMLVTGGAGTTTLTVTRGYDGSTAANHSNLATVTALNCCFGIANNSGSATFASVGGGTYLWATMFVGVSASNISINVQNSADFGMLIGNVQNVNLTNYSKSGTGWRISGTGDDALHMWGPISGLIVDGPTLQSADNRIVFSNEEGHNQISQGLGFAGNIDVSVYNLSITPINYLLNTTHSGFQLFPSENTTINITLDGMVVENEWGTVISESAVNGATGGSFALQMANISGNLVNNGGTQFVQIVSPFTCTRCSLANFAFTSAATGSYMLLIESDTLPPGPLNVSAANISLPAGWSFQEASSGVPTIAYSGATTINNASGGYSAGEAAQYASDQETVALSTSVILVGNSILGQAGEYVPAAGSGSFTSNVAPGTTVYGSFNTYASSGAGTWVDGAPTTTPSVQVYVNNAPNSALTTTVSASVHESALTGTYIFTLTVPADFAIGTQITCIPVATIGGVTCQGMPRNYIVGSAGGGGGSPVPPIVGTASNQPEPVHLPFALQYGEYNCSILIEDENGNPVTLTGRTLEMVFFSSMIPSVEIFSLTTESGLAVDGTTTNQLDISIPPANTQSSLVLTWNLWDTTTSGQPVPLLTGTLPIGSNPAP